MTIEDIFVGLMIGTMDEINVTGLSLVGRGNESDDDNHKSLDHNTALRWISTTEMTLKGNVAMVTEIKTKGQREENSVVPAQVASVSYQSRKNLSASEQIKPRGYRRKAELRSKIYIYSCPGPLANPETNRGRTKEGGSWLRQGR
jgi:hypothetical protein